LESAIKDKADLHELGKEMIVLFQSKDMDVMD